MRLFVGVCCYFLVGVVVDCFCLFFLVLLAGKKKKRKDKAAQDDIFAGDEGLLL